MKKVKKSFPDNDKKPVCEFLVNPRDNIRPCPSCGLITLAGMPGGRDSICANCGYKDPCCYD